MYGLKMVSLDVVERICALDNQGEYMANQIYDYMKLAVTEDIINEILDKCNSLTQGEDVDEFYDEMEECSSIMEELDKNVEEISNNIDNINNLEEVPVDILNNMKLQLENIINTVGDDEYSKEVRNNYFDAYKQFFRQYVKWEEVVCGSLDNIMIETNDYLVNVNKVKSYVNLMEQDLDGKKSKLDKELYEIMEGELVDIKEIVNQDKDIYNVITNQDNTIVQKRIANNVRESMNSIIERTKDLNYSQNKLSNYEGGEQLIKESYICVCKALEDINGYDSRGLKVNYTKPQGKKKKNEVLEFVKKIKKDGVMGYVTDGTLSKKSINTNKLPSQTTFINKGSKQWDNLGSIQENIRKALISQYIFDKFNSFVSNSDNGQLNYEVEYILGGKNSDKENISKVINKVITIREGFNLIYLMKDNIKREEAYEAALTITGFTGNAIIVRITQFLILGAWAYAESVVDVKDLLAGYRVNIMKSKSEWNLSLSGIKNLSSTDKDREKRNGLSYEDYLRVMLFTQDKVEQIFRIMDMIEINIQSKYNKNFKIVDCMVGISVGIEYEVKRIFSTIGYAKDYILYKDDKFVIKITKSYTY
jgi:hypothetical protein